MAFAFPSNPTLGDTLVQGGVLYLFDGISWTGQNNNDSTVITFVFDGGGNTITTGVKGDLSVGFNYTIQDYVMLADQTGSIVIDIWKDTYANFPPTVANTITASAKPTISSGVKATDTTLTGWTKPITAGDILRFNVDSATTVQRVMLVLRVTRT